MGLHLFCQIQSQAHTINNTKAKKHGLQKKDPMHSNKKRTTPYQTVHGAMGQEMDDKMIITIIAIIVILHEVCDYMMISILKQIAW